LKTRKSNSQYVFKIALARRRAVWRKIALPGGQTLDDLHRAIFHAFDRFDEHRYCFYFPKPGIRGRERLRDAVEYGQPTPGVRDAETATLDSLKLKAGQGFVYLFDFGDRWWHEVTVEQIGGVGAGDYPRLVEKHGSSPPQYREVR